MKVILKSRINIDSDGIRREVDIMKGLFHSNVVQYFDSLKMKKEFYFIITYINEGFFAAVAPKMDT